MLSKRERRPSSSPPSHLRRSSWIADFGMSIDFSEDALFEKATNYSERKEPFFQEEEKEDSESDKDDEDSDAGEEEKEDSESDKNDEDSDAGDEALNSYEKMIEKKRAERMAFMKSLQIDEVKAEFSEAMSSVMKNNKPVKRKSTERERKPPLPRPKSIRIANFSTSTNLSEKYLYWKAINDAKKEEIPAELPFKEALQCEDLYEKFCENFDIQASDTEFKLFSYDESVVKNLILLNSNIAQVTPYRITATAWYPFPENLIFAAGDRDGNLGIWKVDSRSDPYVLKNHSEHISNLMFNPFNASCLVSSSYEGTLRSGDMVKHVFNEVYNVSDKTCCTYFDVLSQTTYLIAQKNGQTVLVDSRAYGKRSQKKYTCHNHSVNTVHVHPVNRNVFVTAENKGSIRLWDLRRLKGKPLADIRHDSSCVKSAYFSPITGNSILVTSLGAIRILDSRRIRVKRTLKPKNCTHKQLVNIRATWLPSSDEDFVVGNMNRDRSIEIYNKDMSVYCILKPKNFTITSLNTFHPSRPAMAGACSSSGTVNVFTLK